MSDPSQMQRTLNDPALTYFDAVRRYGSIREAARRLEVAPSAINRQIVNLEVIAGMLLFERWPDGMRLTQAGEVFARYAIAVLQEEVRTLEELDGLRGLRRGHVSLITVESLNATFLPTLVGRITKKFPGLELQVRTAGSNVIPSAIIAGEADIGMAFSLTQDPDLTQMAVGAFRFGAMMRPDHPLAREREISLSACANYPLVLPSAELSIHTLLHQKLRRFRGKLDVVASVGSLELAKQIVLQSGALAFQGRVGLEAQIADGSLVHVPLGGADKMVTELGVYVRNGRALPVAVDAFVAEARDELAEMVKAES